MFLVLSFFCSFSITALYEFPNKCSNFYDGFFCHFFLKSLLQVTKGSFDSNDMFPFLASHFWVVPLTPFGIHVVGFNRQE
uniref:Secreted protein n=1 Tax=Rhizophora mucronata TaxID=61149 RepID=A0A2P2QMB0_RHIMU